MLESVSITKSISTVRLLPRVRYFGKLANSMMEHVKMNAAAGNDSIPEETPADVKEKSHVKSTPEIEKKFVHGVYDAIAPHFSCTRFAKWPKVAEFLGSLPRGSVVLDVGCGNGKYLGFNKDCYFIGCDFSAPLVNICSGKGYEVLVADAINLPYRTGFGDAAISIAVLHHLSTVERRIKAIEELLRIVRKGGKILITVWAREQENNSLIEKWTPLTQKYMEEWVGPTNVVEAQPTSIPLEIIQEGNIHGSDLLETGEKSCQSNEDSSSTSSQVPHESKRQEYFVPWHLPYHRAEASGSSSSHIATGFAKKDEQKGSVVYNRYYHVFEEGELERLTSGITSGVIVDSFYDKSNWCIVIEKT